MKCIEARISQTMPTDPQPPLDFQTDSPQFDQSSTEDLIILISVVGSESPRLAVLTGKSESKHTRFAPLLPVCRPSRSYRVVARIDMSIVGHRTESLLSARRALHQIAELFHVCCARISHHEIAQPVRTPRFHPERRLLRGRACRTDAFPFSTVLENECR